MTVRETVELEMLTFAQAEAQWPPGAGPGTSAQIR